MISFVMLLIAKGIINFSDKELSIYSSKGKRAVSRFLKLKSKRKGVWSKRESLRAEEADLKEKLISMPVGFTHVSHMGPGDGLMILKDLPEVNMIISLRNLVDKWQNYKKGLIAF